MDLGETPRARDLRERLTAFLEEDVLPAEPFYVRPLTERPPVST